MPRARAHGVSVDGGAADRVLAGAGLGATLLLAPAMLLVFVRQLVEFRDPFVPWSEDALLLLGGTAWGRTFISGLFLSVMVPAFYLLARARPAGWPLATVAMLAMGVFPALTGHASASGGAPLLTIPADVLHVWAAGAWIGGLAAVLWLDRALRSRESAGSSSLLRGLIPAFSPVAIASVAVLTATGVLAAWVHLPEPLALLTSSYGRTLLLKLTIVAVVLGLGFVNWRRLTPALGRDGGPARMTRSARVELTVAQIVLLVTAVLVRTPPPVGP